MKYGLERTRSFGSWTEESVPLNEAAPSVAPPGPEPVAAATFQAVAVSPPTRSAASLRAVPVAASPSRQYDSGFVVQDHAAVLRGTLVLVPAARGLRTDALRRRAGRREPVSLVGVRPDQTGPTVDRVGRHGDHVPPDQVKSR
ncbi:hypothetical protein OG216_17000 [Streptomycetaceae bacterium NBC_01309]